MTSPALWRELCDRNLVIVKKLFVESNIHTDSPKESVVSKSLEIQ